VIELYWSQILPFEGAELRQTTQQTASILRQVHQLRTSTGAGHRQVTLAVARHGHDQAYEATVSGVTLTLAQQPLHRLQRVGKDPSSTFLYDDQWLHDHLSATQLAAHGGSLHLYPGVAWALARLAGLLRPLVEDLWASDVRRWNPHLTADVPDIAGHLFGRDRIALKPARDALVQAFGPICFYCRTIVGTTGSSRPRASLESDRVGRSHEPWCSPVGDATPIRATRCRRRTSWSRPSTATT